MMKQRGVDFVSTVTLGIINSRSDDGLIGDQKIKDNQKKEK